MESGLRKGYRGGARRSSKVGVPEFPAKTPGIAGRIRSSNVGVPAFLSRRSFFTNSHQGRQ